MTETLETEAASLIVELSKLRREMREFEAQSTELLRSPAPSSGPDSSNRALTAVADANPNPLA